MSRVIAVIGTAGRDKNIKLTAKHWDFMCQSLADEIKPEDIVVSGGAAWADHVAIWTYGNELCTGLVLHLPAPFNGTHFEGGYGTSGGACNYYHDLFSKEMGFHSRGHIAQAIGQPEVAMTYQIAAQGYAAMATRNRLVARDCTHMVAFTFGAGNVPADGGTKITWDMAGDKQRAHVSLIGV